MGIPYTLLTAHLALPDREATSLQVRFELVTNDPNLYGNAKYVPTKSYYGTAVMMSGNSVYGYTELMFADQIVFEWRSAMNALINPIEVDCNQAIIDAIVLQSSDFVPSIVTGNVVAVPTPAIPYEACPVDSINFNVVSSVVWAYHVTSHAPT